MANEKIIAMKSGLVSEIADKIKRAQSVIICDYRGLTVEEDTKMRAELRNADVEYVVLKNSMVERAAKEAGIDDAILEMLKGPSAFAFGYGDAVAPAKILKENLKKFKKGELKGGILEGKVIDAKTVDQIADLPSREQMLARMLGSMKSPVQKLAIALSEVAKQKEA
jgi:large subunit ribosomal protein L10